MSAQQVFTELAAGYQQMMDRELGGFLGLGYEEFVDRLLEVVAVREGDLVLDVATGTGLIPIKLANRLEAAGRVVGLDITPAMLAFAKNNSQAAGSPGWTCWVCASGLAMPFVENLFDVVICAFGTHHMHVPTMLSEMRRVLRTDGKLMLVDVGASRLWRTFCGRILMRFFLSVYGLTHCSARAQIEIEAFANVYTADEWRAMLLEAGFTQVTVERSRPRRPWYPGALTIQGT